MIVDAAFSLTGIINRMVRSKGTEEDIKNFKEDLEKYVRQKQRDVAARMLERIYDNNRSALRKDAESAEIGKISLLIGEDASVEEYERKKILGILYPMLQEDLGDFL
ncbi:MAG: hypothetical protein K2M91_11740 [Lachnospiraceae bacterium]|nr:hypothetical protein [Lachnospiraceae bacterium]